MPWYKSTLIRGRGVNYANRSRRLEAQECRAIPPPGLEPYEHRAVGPQREAVLGDERSQEVSAQLLQPLVILARHHDPRVQAAAIASRLQWARRLYPGRIGLVAEAFDTRTGPRPERKPLLDCRIGEPGESDGLGRQRVGGVGIQAKAAPCEQPADAAGDRGHQPRDVRVRGRRQAMEPQCPVHPRLEHAVEAQDIEVHVQFQPRTKSLHHGDCAAAAVGDPCAPGAAAIPPEHGAGEHAEHSAT